MARGLTTTTCPCGKVAFLSRADARAARKAMPGGGHLNAYECQYTPEYAAPVWHLGHLAPEIRSGRMDRSAASQAPRKVPTQRFTRP